MYGSRDFRIRHPEPSVAKRFLCSGDNNRLVSRGKRLDRAIPESLSGVAVQSAWKVWQQGSTGGPRNACRVSGKPLLPRLGHQRRVSGSPLSPTSNRSPGRLFPWPAFRPEQPAPPGREGAQRACGALPRQASSSSYALPRCASGQFLIGAVAAGRVACHSSSPAPGPRPLIKPANAPSGLRRFTILHPLSQAIGIQAAT